MKSKVLFLLVLGCLLAGCRAVPTSGPAVTNQPAVTDQPVVTDQLTTTDRPVPPVPTTAVPATASVTPPSAVLEPTPTPVALDKDAITADNFRELSLLNHFGGKGMIRSLQYSVDGTRLAVRTDRGVYTYEAQTLESSRAFALFREDDIQILQTTFNPQGELLAFGWRYSESVSCTLHVWRLAGEAWQEVGKGETGDPECLGDQIFSPDGKYLASASYAQKAVLVWRASDMTQVQTLPIEYPGDVYSLMQIDLALSGQERLAIDNKEFISVYDLKTGERIERLEGPESAYFSNLAISLDGQVIAARAQEAGITVWQPGKDPITLDVPAGEFMSEGIELSRDGAFLAFTYTDESSIQPVVQIEIWRTDDGSRVNSLPPVRDSWGAMLAFSPEGDRLVVGPGAGMGLWDVNVWDIHQATLTGSIEDLQGVMGVLSPDGSLLADGSIQDLVLYRVMDGQAVQRLPGEASTQMVYLPPPVFSPDSQRLAAIRQPGEIQVWQTADGKLLNTLKHECAGPDSSLIFSVDGELLSVYARSSDCQGVVTWRIADETLLYEFKGSGGEAFTLLADGSTLVVEDETAGSVSLVQVQTGATLCTLPRPKTSEFNAILWAFSPATRYYALGVSDGAIGVWNIDTGEQLYSLTNPYEWGALAFSPDGSSLITTSDTAQHRDAMTGEVQLILSGAIPYPRVLYSPDGKMTVTVSEGKSHLWNLEDDIRLRSLDTTAPLFFTSDGKLLVSYENSTIHFWQVDTGELVHSLPGAAAPAKITPDGRYLICMSEGLVEVWGVK